MSVTIAAKALISIVIGCSHYGADDATYCVANVVHNVPVTMEQCDVTSDAMANAIATGLTRLEQTGVKSSSACYDGQEAEDVQKTLGQYITDELGADSWKIKHYDSAAPSVITRIETSEDAGKAQ